MGPEPAPWAGAADSTAAAGTLRGPKLAIDRSGQLVQVHPYYKIEPYGKPPTNRLGGTTLCQTCPRFLLSGSAKGRLTTRT